MALDLERPAGVIPEKGNERREGVSGRQGSIRIDASPEVLQTIYLIFSVILFRSQNFETVFSLRPQKCILEVLFSITCPEIGFFRDRQGPHCEELLRSLDLI